MIYEFTKFFIPALIFPLNPSRTMAIRRRYGGIIKKSMPEFKPFAQPPSFCSATALHCEHNANAD
tara:strand:+ start:733 stop:927 length:195 start_codon:yes stop_codon:yes gene_type:complete